MLWLLPFLSCVLSSSLDFSEEELAPLATCSVFSVCATCSALELWRCDKAKPSTASTAKLAIMRQRLSAFLFFPIISVLFFIVTL